MKNLKASLTESFRTGTFLQTVYEHYMEERDESDRLPAALIALHNEGAIDVIAGFASLENKPEAPHDFFLMRHIFERTLPQITSPIQPVMACVNQLFKEAGHNGAGGTIFQAYGSFCEKDLSRPKDALSEIEADHRFLNLLSPTLIAGSKLDSQHYLAETIRLTHHSSIEFRKRAIFALGKIHWPNAPTAPEAVYDVLKKQLGTADDDELLGA